MDYSQYQESGQWSEKSRQDSKQKTRTETELQQAQYQLPQSKSRVLIPKIITLITLGTVFYLGILINISLLKLTGSEETIIKTSSLLLLLLIISIGTFLSFRNSKETYSFYPHQIIFKKKEIRYNEITNTNPQQDFLDKIFKTYSINLNNKFHINHISKDIQIQNYLQQMIEYNKLR